MKKILLSLVAVAALTFASCDAKKEVLDAKTLNGAWNVVELNGASITPSEETPYLDLNFQDNRLAGSGGCNRLMGQIVTSDSIKSDISFPNTATTMMACPNMDKETEFLKALSSVKSVEAMKEGKVGFVGADNKVLFVVAKRN